MPAGDLFGAPPALSADRPPLLWVNSRKRKTYLHAIIDDATRYIVRSGKPSSAASLLLVGDETLARRLDLQILSPIRSRLTGIIKTQYLNEYESRLFIEHRLKNASAPANLFEKDAIEIIAASTRGNRRALMNTATRKLFGIVYKRSFCKWLKIQ